MKYLIINQSRSGVGGVYWWWLPNRRGYTTSIDNAGRYTIEEIAEIIQDARGNERILAEQDLDHLHTYRVMESDDDDNEATIERLHAENYAAATARPAPAGAESEER